MFPHDLAIRSRKCGFPQQLVSVPPWFPNSRALLLSACAPALPSTTFGFGSSGTVCLIVQGQERRKDRCPTSHDTNGTRQRRAWQAPVHFKRSRLVSTTLVWPQGLSAGLFSQACSQGAEHFATQRVIIRPKVASWALRFGHRARTLSCHWANVTTPA